MNLKLEVVYIGNGKNNRFIHNFPPVNSTVVHMDRDGFTIESSEDKEVTYVIKKSCNTKQEEYPLIMSISEQ